MTAREVISLLNQDGWYLVPGKASSHKQFKHATKSGKVTVAAHGAADIPKGTLNSILKQAGLK